MYKTGLSAYQNISLETSVNQASPHKLIVLLFDGALNAIKLAKLYMEKGDIPSKGTTISKAINIIENGLRSCLNLEEGGEIASNLDSLYEYISHELLLANLHNDPIKLQQCFDLLENIASAWREIA